MKREKTERDEAGRPNVPEREPFGVWHDREVDALDYQAELRSEWDTDQQTER
jgi:hypothetical protein